MVMVIPPSSLGGVHTIACTSLAEPIEHRAWVNMISDCTSIGAGLYMHVNYSGNSLTQHHTQAGDQKNRSIYY